MLQSLLNRVKIKHNLNPLAVTDIFQIHISNHFASVTSMEIS